MLGMKNELQVSCHSAVIQAVTQLLECRLGPGGHTLVCFTEVGSAVFARQCLTSAGLGQDSDTEDDMCEDIDDDDINIADIDGLKFTVTFYIESLDLQFTNTQVQLRIIFIVLEILLFKFYVKTFTT